MSIATVTTKSRITIPASVRKALGVGIGDRLAFVRTPAGRFEIAPAKNQKSVRKLKGVGAKAGRTLSVEAMNQVIALRRAAK